MAARTARFALTEILVEIEWIGRVTADKSLVDFQSDRILRYAVERSIEIISEASRRIPEVWKQTQPQIAWRAIAGIGNMMRHEYHVSSAEIVWNAVQDDLAPLAAAVQAIARAVPLDDDVAGLGE